MITLSDFLSRTPPNTCITAVNHYHYHIRMLIHHFSCPFGRIHAIQFFCSFDMVITKTNNCWWYSLFSSVWYDKMTSTGISYQLRLSGIRNVINSSARCHMVLTCFHSISITLFCFLSNQYVLVSVFLPFPFFSLSSFVLHFTFSDSLSYYLFYSFLPLFVYKLYKSSMGYKSILPHSFSFSLRHKVLAVF